MLIRPSDIFSSTTVMLLGLGFTLKRCFLLSLFSTSLLKKSPKINLWFKLFICSNYTYLVNQKEKHVSIRHNSILTLMKSGASFFHIDMINMTLS